MAQTKHTPKWRKDNWITESNQECTVIIEDGTHGVTHVAIVYADEDANLIVNAPDLQSRIKELEAEKAELRGALQAFVDAFGPFERKPQRVPPFKEGDTYCSPAAMPIPTEIAEQARTALAKTEPK